MVIEKEDFIYVDYTSKVKETGEVFDTTIKDVAKKEGLYKEGEIYEPKLVVVGEGWVLEALDEKLLDLEVGKPSSVEIPPEKAFGPRDPEKVKLYPVRRLTSQGITPEVGMRVEINGRPATVRTVGSGRVRLDFNPPLAGKTLVYDLTVEKKLKTKKEKMKALVHRRIPAVDIEKFSLKMTKKTAKIKVPEEAFYIEGLQLAKRGITTDIQRFFPEKTKISFIETFETKESGAE
ncbi:peptidylprolyl isomerase [Candidatus Bathyarchaeota archaeon]|nr:peptidylprolyl isomerase [Candidatus Bathyarchaeota archaeon]NIU80748.1 peptidylprolyl isomerase [Candidatus Bathyarchaeota archaeon]NIV67376.1 peptidylprolyl isomerase [Candidatus Bathyarchaeota archaeon]NIW15920.1 peptidylprolyl isomerase [Candidatus Bathyarchaeota archaeon]NIW34022.1 peptidylprolyl isomerase [Candidatus Bathyarchaeota archaeon]